MKPIQNAAVARAFDAYPPNMRRKLLALRQLIFDTAAATDGVGELEEVLKWGEPAYLTSQSKSGSTIRIGWKKSQPTLKETPGRSRVSLTPSGGLARSDRFGGAQYAMYFHCQTNLVETFRTLFPNDFRFEGNRSIVFDEDAAVPLDALAFCVAAALTYHRQRKASPR